MLKSIFDRFAVLFTIPIVWLYAYLLTVGGAYRNAPPKTQFHCRTDRSGLIGGAPWYCLQFWRYNCSFFTIFAVEMYDQFPTFPQMKWQDKSTISLSVGCSNFWCGWSFRDDGSIICCSRGGLAHCSRKKKIKYQHIIAICGFVWWHNNDLTNWLALVFVVHWGLHCCL